MTKVRRLRSYRYFVQVDTGLSYATATSTGATSCATNCRADDFILRRRLVVRRVLKISFGCSSGLEAHREGGAFRLSVIAAAKVLLRERTECTSMPAVIGLVNFFKGDFQSLVNFFSPNSCKNDIYWSPF
ncbi:unnamed protein product, partial [Laminaria digitata]